MEQPIWRLSGCRPTVLDMQDFMARKRIKHDVLRLGKSDMSMAVIVTFCGHKELECEE